MAVAWFLAPYKRRDLEDGTPGRYCAMNDFTSQIFAEGGYWSESECLGDQAIVKVRASAATLQAIANTAGMQRLPKDRLDDPLADLSVAQRRALRDRLEALGYPLDEIRATLGNNLDTVTLRDVLRFALRRRRKPRYDAATDTIVLDGPVQPTRPLEHADAAVSEG